MEQEAKHPFLWDGSLKETISYISEGISAEVDECRKLFDQKYEVVVRFEHLSNCIPDNVWCNDKLIMCRKKKNGPVIFGKGVELIEGIPTRSGGSNAYPVPYFEKGYCVLKWTSEGIPIFTHSTFRWKISFASITKK